MGFENPLLVIRIFLKIAPPDTPTIRLRKQRLTFKVRGAMDVWSIKETFLDRFYERCGFAVQPGWQVMDVGAGVGDYTLFAAQAGRKVQVFAFEPFPGSFELLQKNRPIDRWRWRLLRWSDAIYATSKHLVPPEWQATVTVITNGVDTERFRPGPAREQAGPLRCVYVSSFRSWHGAEDLVEAVRLCSLKGVPLSVACLGQGPRWEAARSAAER